MLFAILALALLAPRPLDDEVHVVAKDDKVLIGTLETESFRLTTPYGSIEVEADHVARIQFGEPAVVEVINGPTFEGDLKLRSLKLKVGRKTENLRVSRLVSLERQGLEAASGGGFAGNWVSSYGPMKLEQTGDEVRGTYGWEDESTLEGKVVDGRLEYEWESSNGSGGEGWFDLWEDEATLTGKYDTSDRSGLFWGAYRAAPKKAEPKLGEVSEGQTEAGLNYHLRLPKEYSASKSYTGIVLLHGSNMTSRSYVDTFASAWPELAERYVLVGLDGERLSAASRKGKRAFNASYVEFSGHEVGDPWRYRQTPALVADSLEELGGELPVERWFVGGHSQGGFLTWAVTMFYPHLVAGAFPMSCNLLVQCEPSFFDDDELEAAQRRVPIAIVHGENDTVVSFTGGTYARDVFQDGGFPALRLFSHPTAAHMFARLPVDEAIAWLEAMSADDAETLVSAAEGFLEEERYRDACAAALRVADARGSAAAQSRVGKVLDAVDRQAAPEARSLLKAIQENAGNRWVDAFWEFRAKFGLAPASKPALNAYARLREEHQEAAEKIFFKARREQDEGRRDRMYREIVHDYYASSYYKLVLGWLE